jgi:hypothetical protein
VAAALPGIAKPVDKSRVFLLIAEICDIVPL